MSRPRTTETLLVALAAVACTTIVGLPDLPGEGTSGAAGSGASGGASPSGGVSGVGGSAADGGAQSSGGKGSGGSPGAGGSGAEGGDDSGGSANTGGTGLGGTDGSGGTTGGTDATGGAGGSAGTGGMGSGGDGGSGGDAGSGAAAGSGGSGGNAGSGAAAGSGGGGAGGKAGTGGTAGTGGSAPDPIVGPCDLFEAANTPCVAAYSTIRVLRGDYTGPLYQVRTGSSTMNTGSGGQTYDISPGPDGFASSEAQELRCSGTFCTISKLYDQSGNGNHLTVAKAGTGNGVPESGLDDYESVANSDILTVGGVSVYSLRMETRQGYRLAAAGVGMPRGNAAQGIYMVADGTRQMATACCWEFGNASIDPKTYKDSTALFFGVGYWGKGNGVGPWFMADLTSGIFAGGSVAGDPGWGAFTGSNSINPTNPTLNVRFAIGFLKTNASNYSLRMAKVVEDSGLATAYDGALPRALSNDGGIVLGVSPSNDNAARGTFFEGAIVSGYPTNTVEQAVFQNVKAVGYGQ